MDSRSRLSGGSLPNGGALPGSSSGGGGGQVDLVRGMALSLRAEQVAPGDAQKLRHLFGVESFPTAKAVTEAVSVPVGAGAGVLMLGIGAAKMFLAETFAIVVGNAERAADGLLDRVPARVVGAARHRYAGRRLALSAQLHRRQRVQNGAGRRFIRMAVAQQVIDIALLWYARAYNLAEFRLAPPARFAQQRAQFCMRLARRLDRCPPGRRLWRRPAHPE